MPYTVAHYIDGSLVTQTSSQPKLIHNPASGDLIGYVPIADQTICNQAVASAKKAWPTWSQTTPAKRAQILFQFRTLLEKHQAELATLLTQEQGKTNADAKGSIARALELIGFHCGLMTQLQGSFSADVSEHIDCYTFRQSLGVCAGVSPFNFPIMVPVWMLIPAIACGNTFILKPSEQAPSSTLRLFELLHEAGLPPGVANCIQGDQSTVEHLLAHRDIAAFTAVASSAVAETIYLKATAAGKRAHTFGGAKNHAVVMPDTDFGLTAKAIVGAAFGSAGERCMAISVVVIVGEQTATHLLAELLPLIKRISIDEGNNPNADLGPLISHAHHQRVLQAVDRGVTEGATLLVDGRYFKHPNYPEGYFMGPCLFDHVQESMTLYQNEIFGPVLALVRVENLEQAIALVNRNQYGNGTAIFTQNGFHARHYSQNIQVGMVGVNIPIPVPVASHPFGGWKRSVFGDHQMHGAESIHFYTKSKTISTRWFLEDNTQNNFVMPENG